MSEPAEEIDYAKRAIERKAAREAQRPKYTKQDLHAMIQILGDRLALALHVMSDHRQFIEHETTVEQMKWLEDWVETLLEFEEPARAEGLTRKFDYYRKLQRYTYLRSGIRGLLRKQIPHPPNV